MKSRFSVTRKIDLYGAPHYCRLETGQGKQTRKEGAFMGNPRGGALAFPVYLDGRGQLKFVLSLGMVRPCVATRYQPGHLPANSPHLDRLSNNQVAGMMVEGAAGAIDKTETASQAAVRETKEELGVPDKLQQPFALGPIVLPDPQLKLGHQHFAVTAVRNMPRRLKPKGDMTFPEQWLAPFRTNLAGIFALHNQGLASANQFLLMALRLKAAMGLPWKHKATFRLPAKVPQRIIFSGLQQEHQLGNDQSGLNVRAYNFSVIDHQGKTRESPNPVVIGSPTAGLDRLSLYIAFRQEGQNMVVLPNAEEQLIAYARGQEKTSFATGINPVLDQEACQAINQGRSSLEQYAQQKTRALLGQNCQPSVSQTLAPVFLDYDLSPVAAHPLMITIKDPSRLHLPADYRAIPLEQVFEEIRQGQLHDQVLETQMLWHQVTTKQPIPNYLGFDRAGFLTAIGHK